MSAPPYRHLYVHVPFCARRCSYCDFAIAVRREVPSIEFAELVGRELASRQVREMRPLLSTLYFGGGTPSRLGADGVARLLDTVRAFVSLEAGAEVTLEANPEDVNAEAVARWRAHGVNRLSLGVQSFDDRVLSWMHRVHDADSALRALSIARDGGIDSFSLDLIFSVPEFLERDWRRDLDVAVSLAPQHVSLYGLTIEQGTPLGRWHGRGDVTESPEERYEAEFLEAHDALATAGYEHYEVSNFAIAGQRARHNGAYWRGVPYLGIGPSAHGFDGVTRRWNVRAFAEWARVVVTGADPVGGHETLTAANREAEAVYLGLRTRDGLELTHAERLAVRPWYESGWIEDVPDSPGGRIRCTASGWLRLDSLAADLTARRSR